jgi:hypothetical protein
MIKQTCLVFSLSVVSASICAEQADPCSGLIAIVSEGKTGNWFTKLLGRAVNKTIGVGVDLVSSTVAKTIAGY